MEFVLKSNGFHCITSFFQHTADFPQYSELLHRLLGAIQSPPDPLEDNNADLTLVEMTFRKARLFSEIFFRNECR